MKWTMLPFRISSEKGNIVQHPRYALPTLYTESLTNRSLDTGSTTNDWKNFTSPTLSLMFIYNGLLPFCCWSIQQSGVPQGTGFHQYISAVPLTTMR